MITIVDKTEDNNAHIKWDIFGKDLHLLDSFTLFRAGSSNGKYAFVKDFISKNDRMIDFGLTHSSNHFRIEAKAKDGEGRSSIPVLVMGQDNEPPAKPEILSATLDEKGLAKIIWKPNTEKDLWGYRIFKSNFSNAEFALLNANPTKDTIFTDTLDFKLGTESVFYFVEASDKRNNRSPLSDTIRLSIPDVIPPNSPVITKLKQINDTISIAFFNSSSEDKVFQTIYRRNLNTEDAWTKIFVMDTLYKDSIYYDAVSVFKGNFAYTMTATDKAGLESVPVSKKEIYLKEPKVKFEAFKNITKSIDKDKKTITIQWDCNEKDDLEAMLVYRGYDKMKMGRYKIIDKPEMSITDAYEDQPSVFYVLKPIYKNTKGDFRSDYIELVLNSELLKNNK